MEILSCEYKELETHQYNKIHKTVYNWTLASAGNFCV